MSTPKMRSVVGRILRDNFNLDNVENLAEFKLVKEYIDNLEADNVKQNDYLASLPALTPIPVIINRTLVNNAFIDIFSSLHSDDGDTRYELTIIEQYLIQQDEKIKELENKARDAEEVVDVANLAEVAMMNHYFAEEVIKQLPEDCGDLFGIGEDCLVMELYPFADLILKHTYEAYNAGRETNGVFVYDAMEELAGLFIAMVMRSNPLKTVSAFEMPELAEFEFDVVRVVAKHTS